MKGPTLGARVFVEGRGYDQADWDTVSADPDCSPDEWSDAKPFAEMFPDLVASARHNAVAAVEPALTRVSLQVSADVLARFKAGGPGWQARMGEALRKAVSL